jgi:8-oxo-dGTP pyrophosphatase MutT (NUDIX family)
MAKSSQKASRVRSSVICVHESTLLVVRMKDPESGQVYLFPPGGMVEAEESPAEAGERETLEETGYKVKVDPKSELIAKYDFKWSGTVYACTTYCYRASLASLKTEKPVFAPYQLGAEWLPLNRIHDAFDYHSEIKAAVLGLLGTSVKD